MPAGKILITGAGRAGTSFIVSALSFTGLDTGFGKEGPRPEPDIRAGCEITSETIFHGTKEQIRQQLAAFPRIMKAPDWAFTLEQILTFKLMPIEHVIFPIRKSEAATRSRLSVGLAWHANTYDEQLAVVRMANGMVLEACVMHDVPFTMLHFPRLITDWKYTYKQLCRGLPELRNKQQLFKQAFQQADAIHRPLAAHHET